MKTANLSLTDICRVALRGEDDTRFVEPDEYRQLLLSRRRLVRCDHEKAAVRGVFDVDFGNRYFVEEEKLFPQEVEDLARAWSVLPPSERSALAEQFAG